MFSFEAFLHFFRILIFRHAMMLFFAIAIASPHFRFRHAAFDTDAFSFDYFAITFTPLLPLFFRRYFIVADAVTL